MSMTEKQKSSAKANNRKNESAKVGSVKILPGHKYSAEQKAEAIRTYESARERFTSQIKTARYVSEILNIGCPETIITWVKQAQIDLGNRNDGLTTEEREELFKLRKENKELYRVNFILKKASALFAMEADNPRIY